MNLEMTTENMAEEGVIQADLQPRSISPQDEGYGVENEGFELKEVEIPNFMNEKLSVNLDGGKHGNMDKKYDPAQTENVKPDNLSSDPKDSIEKLNDPESSLEQRKQKLAAKINLRKKIEAWSMVAICFVIVAIVEGNQFSIGLLLVEIIDEFDATNADAAWISSLFQLWIFLTTPLGSILLMSYGPRVVCFTGATILTVGIVTSKFVTQLWHLYITMGIISGIGTGLLTFICNTSLCYWFDDNKNISFATGISSSGSGVGLFLFPPLLTYLISEFGWRNTFLFIGGISLQIFVVSSAINPSEKIKAVMMKQSREISCPNAEKISEEPERKQSSSSLASPDRVNHQEILCGSSNTNKFLNTFIRMFKSTFNFRICSHAEYSIFVIANMVGLSTLKTPFMYIPLRTKLLGIDRSSISWIVSATGIANMFGRIAGGVVGDLRVFRTRKLYLLGAAWMLAGLPTALNLPSSFLVQLILSVLFGIGFGAIFTLQPVVLRDLMGLEKLASAYGILRFLTAIPALIGAPLLGLIYDLTKNYTWLYVAAGVTMCVSSLLHLSIIIVQRKKSAKMHVSLD